MDNYKCQSIIKDLRRFSRSIGVQIRVFEDNKTLYKQGYKACYNIQTKVILVSKRACKTNEELIYTIAHELGHAVDLDRETEVGLEALAQGWEKYTEVSNAGLFVPLFVQEFVLKREKAAFDEGNAILLQLGVSIPEELKNALEQENELNYMYSFNLDADKGY